MLPIDVPRTTFINYITQLNTINEGGVLTQNSISWDTPIFRTLSFDSELDEIVSLQRRNKELKEKLARKYRHVSQLQKRVNHLEGMLLISQSGVVSDDAPPPGLSETPSAPMKEQEITAFADQDAGWSEEIAGEYDSTMDLANNGNSNLGNFLLRPLRQSAQSWVVGQPFFYRFNPWQAFCENPFIRDKITNYQLLRMKMHCKIVISGTKFHYGRALVSYNPFTKGDQVTVERNFIQQDLIQASQKPHFFLNPTTNTGGEMCMPFFYDKNYLSIPAADWSDMGDITINSFGNLLHANGGNDPITVTIYLWAEDVVLTIPTASSAPLASQSGRRPQRKVSSANQKNSINNQDEYGSGIISKPAAAIAKAAGALSSLPVIGPYMTATQIASGAAANVAQLFGYSRPNVITDTNIMKPSPTGNLANTDAADAALKLTLDSKAELSVDSRTVGLDGTDQMGITDYACRESYLTSFGWSPSADADTLLWNTRVLPMQLDNTEGEIHMTPLAHVASMFEAWQGSLKFRFQIVKSDFHKGRILARWDPNSFTSSVDYNVNYSRVIDIAETDDFEIVVGWGQSEPWKECGAPYATGSNFSSATRILANDEQGNGMLELAVLNELVSPSIDSPITINVFVSACEDIKFAGPTNSKVRNIHLFPPVAAQGNPAGNRVLNSQASSPNTETGDTTESDKPTAPAELQTIARRSTPDDNTYLVYYGDPPTSLRELMKRYTLARYWVSPNPDNGRITVTTLTNKNYSYHSGWDPQGIDLAQDDTRPLTLTPKSYQAWFTPAFAGVRGSSRKKYLFDSSFQQSPTVTRAPLLTSGNGAFNVSDRAITNPEAQLTKWLSNERAPTSGRGSTATNLEINNTIEVELPYYLDRRFTPARSIQAQDLGSASHQVQYIDYNPTGGAQDGVILAAQQYDAVGEDFSLFFYTGVPIYYSYVLTDLT